MKEKRLQEAVEAMAAMPGLEGCALVEIEAGMVWNHAGQMAACVPAMSAATTPGQERPVRARPATAIIARPVNTTAGIQRRANRMGRSMPELCAMVATCALANQW